MYTPILFKIEVATTMPLPGEPPTTMGARTHSGTVDASDRASRKHKARKHSRIKVGIAAPITK